ncbi:MAG: TonB-dependent receptor, partial [Bacteroidetes bacterium]|nr:TonB-dependent receptor [Bacteroidota bacterium]
SFVLLFLGLISAQAQELKQTIRGTVVDAVTRQPLPGATVEIKNDQHGYGGISEADGAWSVTEVRVGRYNIVCNYIGYEPVNLYQIEVTATKEVVLNFEMTEDLQTMKAAVVNLRKDKSKTINADIQVSGRTFSIEESQRYAGSRGDVARMAQNFAGVQGADDSRNDIIVRGNSPMGVLYRLDGIDIPNPNHYSSAGTTGGPVSMLNNNVLLNSDFISGAFPAEYGNANAAVFDLRVREGNNEKFEFLGQIGFSGFEAMAEGPVKITERSSFLVNYRYSALGALSSLGVNFGTGTAIPKYQDLTFKLHMPDKRGYTSLFGLGGQSEIKLFQSDETSENLFSEGQEDLNYATKTGVIGLTRFQQINSKTNLKFILSADGSQTQTHLDTFSWVNGEVADYGGKYRDGSSQGKLAFTAVLTHKFDARTTISGGTRYYQYLFNLTDSVYVPSYNRWVMPTSFDGSTGLSQTFANLNYRINSKLRVNAGVNYAYFAYNGSNALEPRLSVSYKVNRRYKMSLGSGLHSQVVPFRVYFEEVEEEDGSKVKVNQDVGLMRSAHYVFSNDVTLAKNTRLKIEAYYQHLFNIPVDAGDWRSYSMLNQGTSFGIEFTDSLVNTGTGRNYGMEFTLERFLSKGFYFLNTVSVYRSLYTDADGHEYSTAFDARYAANLLAGKEIYFKEKNTKKGYKKPSMTIDVKGILNGGKRYTPIDVEASMREGKTVYTDDVYSGQYADYMRLDLRVAYKVQTRKLTQEWGIDIQNATNHQNIFTQRFNPSTGMLDKAYQTGILPIGIYRATF